MLATSLKKIPFSKLMTMEGNCQSRKPGKFREIVSINNATLKIRRVQAEFLTEQTFHTTIPYHFIAKIKITKN